MPPQDYSAYTQRVYQNVPSFMREKDAKTGYPLLRYISTMSEQGDDASALLSRFSTEDGGSSDLTDPSTADVAWLPWIAQLVGVKYDPRVSELERRAAIANASSGWRAGTRAAIIAAVKVYLSGSQYVGLRVHETALNTPGTMWDVLIVTMRSETSGWNTLETTYPDWDALEAAGSWQTIEESTMLPVNELVTNAGAKPAGVLLHHDYSNVTWGDLHVAQPAWSNWHTLDTWAGLYEA